VGGALRAMAVWTAAAAWAGPPLTTIQDVLYKADGTPFNGVVFIEWRSFLTAQGDNIATQRVTVRIANGLLRVQLTPTTTATPPSTYTVRYNSDGKVQFEEIWAVPPSATPLRVRDVRVGTPAGPGQQSEAIQIGDVIGLAEALAARAEKGPGYAPARAAFINAAGALEAVAGNLSDCVRVDGSAGPCGTGGDGNGAAFVDAETPAGLINGSNAVFTLADSPSPGSGLALYRNGLLQKQGLDYTLSGNVITFAAEAIPQPGDVLTASYRLEGSIPGGHELLSERHSDTTPAAPVRGDLIVGLGTSPTSWTRLPLGPANRCLMSNGQDAVWNTCLFTNFPAGSVPFTDASGNLAHNNARLYWDNQNRRLSLGNNTSLTTLFVWDGTAITGSTTVTVRAGEGQGSAPLASWQNVYGTEVARVEATGQFTGSSFRAASSAGQAGWRDTGSASDPAGPSSGDWWYNTSAEARKSVEGGQVHTQPQVLCSSTGASTSETAPARLGSCTIPANLLKAGDRVDIRFDYSHQGTATGFQIEVRWGTTTLVSRSADGATALAAGRADAAVRAAGVQFSALSWGSGLNLSASAGTAGDPLSAPLTIEFLGAMAGPTAETVKLENFTAIRYPAQANP